ncbi:hypothetical protein D3C73_1291210 [compost metagenome]
MAHSELEENHNRTIQFLQASDTDRINDCQVEHCYRNTHMKNKEELYLPSLAVDNHSMVISAIQDKGIQAP